MPLVELGTTTRKCKVEKIGNRKIRIVLTQGLNRQIRRMCEAVGLDVLRLKRLEIAGVKLGGLKLGAWRNLNERELVRLTNISQSKDEEEC